MSTRAPIPAHVWRSVLARYGGRCVLRPARWPALPLGLELLHLGVTTSRVLVVVALVGVFGVPTTRPWGCSGRLQRAHQWAHAHGGSTRGSNIEPACSRHNRAQGAQWTWIAVARCWPPGLVFYALRRLRAAV